MEALLYFVKVILSSAVLFIYYRLFLKDKTFHHYNRFYLLSIVVISILLPILKVSYFTLEVNNRIYLLFNKLEPFNHSKDIDYDFPYFTIFTFIFGLASLLFLAKFIVGLIKIERLKTRFYW
jgi:hypothetical protein